MDAMPMSRKRSPPVACIPKNAYDDTDFGHDFGMSDNDSVLSLPKAKRPRRFFDLDPRETGVTGKDSVTTGDKVLEGLCHKQFRRLLEKCGLKLGVSDIAQEMWSDNEEQEASETEYSSSVTESLSEDELSIIGGPDQDENTVNSDPQEAFAMPQPAHPMAHGPDFNNDARINIQPNTKMRDSFREYCREQQCLDPTFTISQERAVRLMGVLKGTRAALNTYDAILEWHHREKGDINGRETLQHVNNVDRYHSRSAMLKTLRERYFLKNKEARRETITLPNSKANVTLTFHNAWDCIESLLTDPRVNDADYNFYGEDPLAPPPEVTLNSNISELHTGIAYYAAYKKFIKFPGKQVLLPIVMYIDGAVTGQFSDLPVTALKLALGIHTRKFREKEMAWRTLGYVAQVSTASSRGKKLLLESGHMESEILELAVGEGEEVVNPNGDVEVCKAQDFHTMLETLLSSYVEVQNNGFIWDLRYRGKTYKDIEFVPFVMFVKCDTDEADVLCGSYKSRTANVAQLCRYCTCPTDESDLVFANYRPKTVKMIQELVDARNFDGLQQLSQQLIKNAWYMIRFHPYTKAGIHGACPSEMLHALLLGVFKYTRECFFTQLGETSKLATDINGLAQQYGDFFQRQSERDKPKCQFKKGIVKGKIMAKEFRGILLVIAAVLRSQNGQDLLSKKQHFADPTTYKDWVRLVELLLQWEAFLNEPQMTVEHIRRLQKKNRFIMYLIKKVVNREKGMGLKLIKFHVIIHMWMDIYLYGVPLEVDTGANESHHKLSKIAAKLTQKNETTFDFQTCTRLDEFFLIELAMAELDDGRRLWNYFTKEADPLEEETPEHLVPKTGGIVVRVFQHNDFGPDPQYSMGTGRDSKKPSALEWNEEVISFLFQLQTKLKVNNLKIRGEHKREGTIFRGHPNYREKPWKDWAMFDWGNEELPGQIWCFVVIDFNPKIRDESGDYVFVHHGGICVKRGTYAVIESSMYDQRDQEKLKSDLFIPIKKEVVRRKHGCTNWKRKFYLADVEAISNPLMVIPNIGGRLGLEYLLMKQQREWVKMFKEWLDKSHDLDQIPLTEPIPAQNCLV